MIDLLGSEARQRGAGMGGHQSARALREEWLTPPHILQSLGPFDLDPCAPVRRPWETAARHFTIADNGLHQEWSGFVFMNPPYGAKTGEWLKRLADHGNGIALVFARTETADWHDHVWACADAVLFLRGRLTFYTVDGKAAAHNGGAPSALIAYGGEAVRRLKRCGLPGKFVGLKREAA